jgi:hypothetical protein
MSIESHKQERDVLTTQIKELQQELQSVKVSVCCLHLAVHCYWELLLLACHRTLRMKIVNVPRILVR